jgi:hypothetical protein
MSALHCSTAYVNAISHRGSPRKPDPITDQFRFIVRLAVACDAQAIPYNIAWSVTGGRMAATILAAGKIPTPKPLAKPPRPRPVSSWKSAVWDAEYRLEAYFDSVRNRRCPGFVIEHSCGLSLVHPSESGELGVTEHGADEDIR